MRQLRTLGALALVFACFLLVPVARAADKPQKFPLPAGPGSLPAAVCGFPVDFVPLQNNEYGKVFSNGVFAVNGVFKMRYTNAVSGKSVDLNISGGGTIVDLGDGTLRLSGHGPAGVFFFPGEVAPGAPGGIFLVHGQFSELIDAATGAPIPGTFTTIGRVQDVCAMLS
jgi:hypothetical protein